MSELNVWLEAAPANQVKSKKPKAQLAATPPADDPSSSSDSDSSSSKSTSSHASSHQKKKKAHKKKSTSKSSSSPRSGKSSVSSPTSKSSSRGNNSYSDSEASSDSSTSHSKVSTSDSSRSRHRRHRKKSSKFSRHRRRRKKSSKSNSRHRRRSPDSGRRHRSKHHSPEAGAAANVRLFSKDPSTGDNRSIFDLSLSDTTKVEEEALALCPPGMASKDRAGFASCLTDVAAMPGTYHRSSTMEKTDMEAVMEGTVALVAQATGNSLILPDGQWKSQRKARLSAVKSSTDLLALWENLAEAESEIFAQQDDRIRSNLYDRHYSTSEIDQFLASGLFIRVITDTYNNYRSLLQTLLSHTNVHGFSGLASELLKYHGKKLLQLRLFSPSYFSFLLRQ
eukprot:scaffold2011_cov26-Cyclotella_meneghiniana.AAC.2